MTEFLQFKRNLSPINSDTIFSPWGIPITNSTMMLFVLLGIVILAAVFLKRKNNLNPGTFQSVLEVFYEGVLKVVTQIVGNERRAAQIFPLIGTLFVFIGLSNLLGLVPGLSSFTLDGKNIFRTATSDFNTTFALAFSMILLLQVVNIKEWGILAYFGKFFQFHLVIKGFRQGLASGMTAVINFFIGLLDIVSEFAKVVSLSLRLFGNMFAGDVLATVILGGVAFVVPALWMSMSLLSAVVQTLVFSCLVTAYYTLAIKPDEPELIINKK